MPRVSEPINAALRAALAVPHLHPRPQEQSAPTGTCLMEVEEGARGIISVGKGQISLASVVARLPGTEETSQFARERGAEDIAKRTAGSLDGAAGFANLAGTAEQVAEHRLYRSRAFRVVVEWARRVRRSG